MPKKNQLSRDEKIFEAMYVNEGTRERSRSSYQAKHIFSKNPHKTSTLTERGAKFQYHELPGSDGSGFFTATAPSDPKTIANAHSAVIHDAIVTDDPSSAIPYLKIVWSSKETDDQALLHKLFSKVREK